MLVLSGYGFLPARTAISQRPVSMFRPSVIIPQKPFTMPQRPTGMSILFNRPAGMPQEAIIKMEEARRRDILRREEQRKRAITSRPVSAISMPKLNIPIVPVFKQVEQVKPLPFVNDVMPLRLEPSPEIPEEGVEYEPEYESDESEFSGILSGREYLKSFYGR